MAKFYVKGKRKRILHIEIIEDIEGDFSITKAEVMDKTGCPAKQDGDSTVWYEYVAEAVKWGAHQSHPDIDAFKQTKDSTVKELSRYVKQDVVWDEIEVDWV